MKQTYKYNVHLLHYHEFQFHIPQTHEIIFRFLTELEDVFNPMMFAQFVSSSGTLCLIIFQITVVSQLCSNLLKA